MRKRFAPTVFSSALVVVAFLSIGGIFGGQSLSQGSPSSSRHMPTPVEDSESASVQPASVPEPKIAGVPLEMASQMSATQAAAGPLPAEQSPESSLSSGSAISTLPTATSSEALGNNATNPSVRGEGRAADAAPLATPTATASSQRTPTSSPQATARLRQRIGLQAGHWKTAEMPDELASLRTSTGAAGKGWTEGQINLDIAGRTASLLEKEGYLVDLLPAPLPEQYKADVFLSLHGDANADVRARGFKLARAVRSLVPDIDDALVAAIYRKYGEMTGLPRDDLRITNNMRYYYAFAGNKTRHAVAPTTPAAILEMGFLTNAIDRDLLTGSPDRVAKAIAASLVEFLKSRS